MLGPRNMAEASDPRPPTHHRHSAKQLINRYESMSNSGNPPPSKASLPGDSFSSLLKKEKSPIRRSFQNLFSVLKKVNLRKGKQVDRPLSSFRKQHHPILDDHPGLDAPPVLRSRSRKMSSSLLYLSRVPQILPDSSDLKAVWASCTVTLEPDAIVIVSRTPHDNPSVRIIELSNCTDVRSLSLQQLDPDESGLLPMKGQHDEFKVFEILFEGRPREKFAANSVQERAGWVSAIWDTILPSQDQEYDENANVIGTCLAPAPDVKSLPPTAVLEIPSSSQRALPPIPINDRPLLANMRTLSTESKSSFCSQTSSQYSSTRPASRTSSKDSRQSPSIANLSQLSVVRQRLAEMEESSSLSPRSAARSPTPSSGTTVVSSLTTPTLEPVILHAMARNQSDQSSAADSILDSYGDHTSRPLESAYTSCFPSPIGSEPETKDLLRPAARMPSISRVHRNPMTTRPPVLEPVVESLHDRSTTNDETKNLSSQVLSLHNEVQKLPAKITSSVNVQGHTNTVLEMVAKLEERARSNEAVLSSIDTKMDKLVTHNRDVSMDDNRKLVKTIQTLRTDIMGNLAHIRSTLDSNSTTPTEMKNIAPSTVQQEVDLSRLHSKIDDLHSSIKAGDHAHSAAGPGIEATLSKIVSIVEKDSAKQEIQVQQQTETVRYLTELNSWIEALVNHNAAKHSVGIEQYRGLNLEEGCPNLIADIRQLAQSTAARDYNLATLQASVNELSACLTENSVESSVARIAALIEHQRQYQEGLVRALGADIFDEIKGERLRFVEAMKEATAINVQTHVEQFKEELKREVVEMTAEVGRLHQDRQAMQNQIADLFAFYKRQKTGVENSQATLGQAGKEKGARRPLPHPG